MLSKSANANLAESDWNHFAKILKKSPAGT